MEYAYALSRALGMPPSIARDIGMIEDDCRKLIITFSRAHYGCVDSAIIEFEGSPPRLSVFVSGLQFSSFTWTVVVKGRTLKSGTKRHGIMVLLITKLLGEYCKEAGVTLSAPKLFVSAAELLDECDKEIERHNQRLSFCGEGITIDDHYFIENHRIDCEWKLLAWVTHLIGKKWMDIEFLHFFIEQVSSRYNIKVHGLHQI